MFYVEVHNRVCVKLIQILSYPGQTTTVRPLSQEKWVPMVVRVTVTMILSIIFQTLRLSWTLIR